MQKTQLIRGFLKTVYWIVIVGIIGSAAYLAFMAYETYRLANP